METQNYANHSRFVKGYHFILSALLLIGLVVSVINFFRHWHQSGQAINLLLILIITSLFFISWFMRVFAIKAQDRAIRAEESLRYFIMTGKAVDSRLKINQIIALRFAPDEEFIALSEQAAAQDLSSKDIKIAIKNWRADHHRA